MAVSIEYSDAIHTNTGIVTSAGTLLSANPTRRTVIIQNLGTNPLFVLLGAGATTSNFTFILKGGTSQSDGTGGTFLEDVLSYRGIISIAGSGISCIGTDI